MCNRLIAVRSARSAVTSDLFQAHLDEAVPYAGNATMRQVLVCTLLCILPIQVRDGPPVVELEPGSVCSVPAIPHDSRVMGDREYVSLHFLGTEQYGMAAEAESNRP